ncbi:DUF6881 domain-containing protein [Actinomadura rugatobispora]|uniref:DUF6881 domain-containing protein n=1 Tax=Actinomadura rugatobispora TaxID=1994 RepID=A0ABW1A958_9ACTN
MASRAPLKWTRIDAVYMLAGNWFHRRIAIETETGPYDGFPPELVDTDSVHELRDVMYMPGAGTWFTMYLTITSDGDVSTSFDYDDRPSMKSPIGLALKADLERYPRSRIPQWMRDEIAEAERLIYERGYPSGSSAPDATAIFPGQASECAPQAIDASAVFSPSDEMRYIRIDRTDDPASDPVTIFCEIDEEGYENRKVEIFPDGRSDYAGGLEEGETTWLNDDPVPMVSEISRRPGFAACEITSAEFQVAWTTAGGFED